jgi:hypothetical protein
MPTVPILTVIQEAQRAALHVVSHLRRLQENAGAKYVLPPLDLLIEYWVEFSPFRNGRDAVTMARPFFLAIRPSRGVRLSGHRAGSAHEVVLQLTAELHSWLSGHATFRAIADFLNNICLDSFGADHAQWNRATQRMSIALWLPPKKARPYLDRSAQTAAANPRVQPFYQGVDDIYNLLVSDRKWDGKTFLKRAKAVPKERYYALATELEERVAELKLDALERQLRWEASRALLKFQGPQVESKADHGSKSNTAKRKRIPPEKRTNTDLATVKPRWDADRRSVWLGERELKRYRRPAPNQEQILAAFEEEGWPPRIDDPLEPGKLRDTLPDLNETIKNEMIEQPSLRFEADGTGKGILWSISRASPADAR